MSAWDPPTDLHVTIWFLMSCRCRFWDHPYIPNLSWETLSLNPLSEYQVPFWKIKDPTRSTRWRKYYIYWLILNRFYRSCDSLFFRDFSLSSSSHYFQENSMIAYNQIVNHWKEKAISQTPFGIPYKWALHRPFF